MLCTARPLRGARCTIWLLAPRPALQVPDGPLRAQQEAALAALGISLEHSLQDGPLSMQASASTTSHPLACAPGRHDMLPARRTAQALMRSRSTSRQRVSHPHPPLCSCWPACG